MKNIEVVCPMCGVVVRDETLEPNQAPPPKYELCENCADNDGSRERIVRKRRGRNED